MRSNPCFYMDYGGGDHLNGCMSAQATILKYRFDVWHILNAGPVCDKLIT